jgi:23S rRNA pseudouridine1911/1915/1917 synthase
VPRNPRPVPPDLSVKTRHYREVIAKEAAGARLDAWLKKRWPWKSREEYQRMIRAGRVLVSGARRKPSTRLLAGDVVRADMGEPEDLLQDPGSIPLRILREDADLVVLDKQPGVLVHPVGKARFNTLTNALHLRYRDLADPARDIVPRIVHRLDRDTSGVLLVAKTDHARAELGRQFEEREVSKEYLALVHGVPREEGGRFDASIVPEPRDRPGRPRMQALPRGEGPPARTDWSVEERFARHALLRLVLHTGRTHQIRVHCRHAGHPLVADDLYGDGKALTASTAAGAEAPRRGEPVLLGRLALHAARLAFTHPVSGRRVVVQAPLPADMAAAVEALRRGDGADGGSRTG